MREIGMMFFLWNLTYNTRLEWKKVCLTLEVPQILMMPKGKGNDGWKK
jgi:hypothetical protein